MMRFATSEDKQVLMEMWKICFGDTDEYIDLIFSNKYKNENTLIYFQEDRAVACLQMQPYTIRMYNEIIPFYYLVGLCTLPEYRNKGYMGKLINESFNVMKSRNIPLSILVPAEDWLYGYYEKFGFVQTFDKGVNPVNLKSIIQEYPYNPDKAFNVFDAQYQKEDFTVLKTEKDFYIIVKEYIADGMPTKYNLGGMASIIDISYFLNLYAKNHPQNEFVVKMKSDEDSTYYHISNKAVLKISTLDFDIEADTKLLTRLIFGYKMNELPSSYSSYFEEHYPILNLMLE